MHQAGSKVSILALAALFVYSLVRAVASFVSTVQMPVCGSAIPGVVIRSQYPFRV